MHLRIPILTLVIVAAFFTARVCEARGGGGHGGGGHGGGGHGGHGGGGHHGGDHGHGGHDHGHGDHGWGHHGWDHHGWGHHGWNHWGWGGGWGGWGAYGYGYDPAYYFPAYGYCNYDAPSVTNNYTENDTQSDSQDNSQDSASDASSYNGPVTVEAGWTALANGQDDDSEDIFDEVLDRNPDSGVARIGLALSMASMGDLPRSVRELRQAVGTRPQALDKVPDDNQQLNAQIDSILARYQGSLGHASNQSDPNFAVAVLQYMRGRKKMASDALNAAVAAGDTSQSAKNLRTLIQGN